MLILAKDRVIQEKVLIFGTGRRGPQKRTDVRWEQQIKVERKNTGRN
jgi:hypothetical protein